MNTNYLHRDCPICRAKTTFKVEVSSEKKAEQIDYEYLIPYWNGFFKEKIFFSYARCSQCHLLFAPIFYNLEQLTALYGQMPPNMDVVPIAALRKTQKGYFEQLKKFCEFKNGYVEIGPDIGIFTENFSKERSFNKYWLFEPNKAVAPALANSVGDNEFEIIEDMFGFGQIPEKSIGAVVMIQVLDHLLDPVSTLSELREKLLPDAKLLIVTHNEQSILSKLLGWKWPAFCLQHPQIYNPSSISKLLENAGYKVDSIEKTKNYFEFGFLLKHLLWALGIQVRNVPEIFNFTIGLKLGNMITVATPR